MKKTTPKQPPTLGWALQIEHAPCVGGTYLAGGMEHEVNFVWYSKRDANEFKRVFDLRGTGRKSKVVRVRWWSPEVVERKKKGGKT